MAAVSTAVSGIGTRIVFIAMAALLPDGSDDTGPAGSNPDASQRVNTTRPAKSSLRSLPHAVPREPLDLTERLEVDLGYTVAPIWPSAMVFNERCSPISEGIRFDGHTLVARIPMPF
jgi:hypothetical protein